MTANGRGRALSICVFCGSAESPPQVFVDTARQLGQELGRRGHRLIYGGTPIGLMGVVARAVQASGGPVVGIVPRGLFDHLIVDESAIELVVAHTLAERKAEMVARADAFIVLPGGYGTLEELVEVLALRQLGLHTRPVVLINVGNFWRPFLQQTRHMAVLGLAQAGEGELFRVVDLANRAIEVVETEVSREPALPVTDRAESSTETSPVSSDP
jgi:cytokinin riboside 5'-monophosphate phosphoribohydrolase